MSIRVLLLGFVFLAAIIVQGGASAYEFDSEISYDVDNATLTGSSETSKESGDWNYDAQCVRWEWGWGPWGEDYYCSLYFAQISFASVVGEIYRETQSDPVNSAYDRDSEDARTTYTEANPERDNWTAQGEHYAEVDGYWVVCHYFFCSWFYAGTAVYELGTTESEKEEVCGEPELDELMREYDDETYAVNLDPGCDDFDDSGDSDNFTWSELNGGFSDGNPHEPYGIVTQDLKDGLGACAVEICDNRDGKFMEV